tara:strand:- start:482 stop:760 length:279 start_codon:yes stop_codon:yes gene_type:complete
MNRPDLVKRISNRLNFLDIKDVEESSVILINFLSENIRQGNRIELRGFGSFSLRKRKGRFSRNPKTGESIYIGTKSYLYFRPSINLKALINK